MLFFHHGEKFGVNQQGLEIHEKNEELRVLIVWCFFQCLVRENITKDQLIGQTFGQKAMCCAFFLIFF